VARCQGVFSAKLEDLHQVWDSVSWQICQRRDNPACADAEHAAAGAPADPGLHVHLTFDPAQDVAAPFLNLSRPKVAVLREQGVNSHVEMAYAFTEAGFEAHDVHMTDLQSGRARLEDFKGVVACGGFSYGDTLGAGIGWARSITFNQVLAEQFQGFFARQDTFGLGVCNGCQMFAELADIIPGAQDWPRFTTNQSERFEARLSLVEVLESPSLFLQGMAGQPPADCRGARRGLRQLQIPWQCRQGHRRHALRGPHGRGHRAVPVQPQRQPRRPDGGDHRGRPLHGHDAAPRARVPQHPDELDGPCRRRWPGRLQPLDAPVAQCAQVGGLSCSVCYENESFWRFVDKRQKLFYNADSTTKCTEFQCNGRISKPMNTSWGVR
jgi:hypothetical protein